MDSLTTSPADGPRGDAGHRPRYRGRQFVFIIDTPPDWKPTSIWSVPPGCTGGELHVKNVSASDAWGAARVFNSRALREMYAGQWRGKWALGCRHLRNRNAGRHPDDHATVAICRNGTPTKIIRRYSKAEAAEFVAAFNELAEGTPVQAIVDDGTGGASCEQ